MPPRSNPTARQARLGSELQKLRLASGMPAREAGALLGGDQAQISHIEAGRWGVSVERVRRLAAFYSVGDTKLIDALCGMAEDQRKGWWRDYRGIIPRGFLDLAELEHHATYLRSLQTLIMPGIFQTEDYARTIFGGAMPPLPASEIDARVEHRVRRRTGSAQSVLYAGGPLPQLDSVYGPAFLDAEAQLSSFRAVYEATERVALDAEKSRDTINRIAQEMREDRR